MLWSELVAQAEVKVKEADKKELPWLMVDLELLRVTALNRLQEPARIPSDLLTIPQLATKLQVDPATLYKRVRRGQMEATHVGRSVRVRESDFTSSVPRGPRRKRLIDIDL
jgi:excisionase family DNA binding protein